MKWVCEQAEKKKTVFFFKSLFVGIDSGHGERVCGEGGEQNN